MTFTLTECHPLVECPPYRQWHAQHIDEGDTTIDVVFFAMSLPIAEDHMRRIFPGAVFST